MHSERQAIARLATKVNCNDEVPADYTLCAFNNARLVNTYRDRAPAKKAANEAWWLIPSDDFAVTLTVNVNQDIIKMGLMIRMEGATKLMRLLADRKLVTVEDLTPLLEKELNSLVDDPEMVETQRLIDLGKPQRERLRARYSLRLQEQGLCCTHIGRCELLLPDAESKTLPTSDMAAAKDVFLSHSSQDKIIANTICTALESQGIRCWVAPRDIPAGLEWGEAIIDAIAASKTMVVIVSSSSNDSVHVKREVERAVNKRLDIIPVRIEDVVLSKTLELYLSSTHWLEAITPPIQNHIPNLALHIQHLISRKADVVEPDLHIPSEFKLKKPSKLEMAMFKFDDDRRILLIPKKRATIGRNRSEVIVLRFLPPSEENDRLSRKISRSHMALELTNDGLLVSACKSNKRGTSSKVVRILDTVIRAGEQHLVSDDLMDESLSLELPDNVNSDQAFRMNLDLFGTVNDDFRPSETSVQEHLQLLQQAVGRSRKPLLWKLVDKNHLEACRLQRRDNLEKEEYVLIYRQALIGSSESSCPICLDDESLPLVAAQLTYLGRSFWLQNLGAPESVQVEGRMIEPSEVIPLEEGMKLQFGKTMVRFERAQQMHL